MGAGTKLINLGLKEAKGASKSVEPKILRLKREHRALLEKVTFNNSEAPFVPASESDAFGAQSIKDSLAFIEKSKEVAKERKINSLGVDVNAYSVHEFNRQVKGSEVSKAANRARGGGGAAYSAAPHHEELTPQEVVDLVHERRAYRGKDAEEQLHLVVYEKRRRITPRLIKQMLQDAKHVLKKPMYITRSENAFTAGGGGKDALHSAEIIDPLDIERYLEHYTGRPEEPVIYKLKPGSTVYGTEGFGDSSREVLVARQSLRSAQSTTNPKYFEALKKGTALFGATAVAATSNSDNAEASPAPIAKVISKVGQLFESAPKQIKALHAKIVEGKDTNGKAAMQVQNYLFNKGAKQHEAAAFVAHPREANKIEAQLAKTDGAQAGEEGFRGLNAALEADKIYGRPGADPYKATDPSNNKNWAPYAPEDTEGSPGYAETSYVLPRSMLSLSARNLTDHLGNPVGTHARSDYTPKGLPTDTGRVIEVQSDAVNIMAKKLHTTNPLDLYDLRPSSPELSLKQRRKDGHDYTSWLNAKRTVENSSEWEIAKYKNGVKGEKLKALHDKLMRSELDAQFPLTTDELMNTSVMKSEQVLRTGEAIDKEIRGTKYFKEHFTPFAHNIKWAQDTINRQLADMANHGKKNIDFLISDSTTDKSRAEGVKHWYKTDYVNMVKAQAKRIGAKVEEVSPNSKPSPVSNALEEYQAAIKMELFKPGILKPAEQNLAVTLANEGQDHPMVVDLARMYSKKTGISIDELDKFGGLNEMIQSVGHELNPKDYEDKSKYLRVKLATGTGGAITAFSVPTFASEGPDSSPDMNPKDPAERIATIQQLMADGTKTSDIQKSLVTNMGEQEGNALLMKALQPNIAGLRKQGVSDEDINKSLQAHGLQLPVQPSPGAQTGGQPESTPSPLRDSAGQLISTPDELVQQVPKATATSLLGSGPGFGKAEDLVKFLSDPHKDLVRPDGTSLSESIARMEDVTQKYSTMGKDFLGTFSASMAAEAAKEKQSSHEIIKAALLAQDWNVDSIGEYGDVLIKNKQTGKLESYDSSMMDTLLAQAYELTGDAMGAYAGGVIGALSPLPGGAAIGATLGASIVSGVMSGADIVRNALLMNYQVDMQDVFTKMNDVGVADATMGALGTTVAATFRGANQLLGRTVQKGYDLVAKGNIEGAYSTVLTNTRLNETQARELVNKWAAATGNKGLGNDALTLEDKRLVIRVLGDSSPELTSLIPRAAVMANAGSARLRSTLDARAKDIIRAAQDATSDNIGSSVIVHLDNYVAKVNAFFDETKKAGIESMKDNAYTFNFDNTALIPALQHAAKGITNPINKKEFYNYVELMREAGGKPVGSVSQIAATKQATVAARTEVSAARAKATELRAERTSVRAKMTAAKKRAKLLKTKKAQDKAIAEAEGHASTIAKLDKQILKATDAVQAKAADVTSSIQSIAKAQQPQTQANAPRSFENLLQLKEKLNELSSDSRFKAATDFAQMHAARDNVDAEIVKAAKKYMPNGDAWVVHWRASNAEYHNMKELEKNSLFKALVSPEASKDSIVKAFAGALGHEGPKTFMQVMGRLPASTRPKVEGAVFQHFVQQATAGDASGAQAINFVQLANDLNKVAFTQPEVRDLKRGVNQMAGVFRNDTSLLNATNNIPLPAFQNSLGINPVAKAKIAVSGVIYNNIRARLPGSTNAGRAALALQLSKILDNPLSNQGIKALEKQLPKDPELGTALHQLATEFTKFGKPEHYGKVPIYRVHQVGQAGKSNSTMIGKGVLYYTDKAKAQRIAKQTGAKVLEVFKVHKTIATPEVVGRIVGHTPTAFDYKDPEVLNILKQTYEGLAVEDKVILFK